MPFSFASLASLRDPFLWKPPPGSHDASGFFPPLRYLLERKSRSNELDDKSYSNTGMAEEAVSGKGSVDK